MRALLFAILVAACAPRALNVSGEHPANPSASTGRSAGPPAALRPGVATLDDPEPPAMPEPAPAMDHSQHAAQPDTAKPSDKPEKPEPQNVEPKAKPPVKTPPKKPAQKPPAKKPPEPAKKPPEPAKKPESEPPMPPMDHSGHGGHQ